MTNTERFARQAETELRDTSSVSAATCRSWRDLDQEGRAAFMQAMDFLCGGPGDNENTRGIETRPTDRIAASRLMLLKLGLHGSDPRWSSDVLTRYVSAVLGVPGGTLNEVFVPLLDLLGKPSQRLSQPLAHFLKDLIILCFTEHRKEYDAVDWTNLAAVINSQLTQAQCYFGLHAIPPQHLTPELARSISDRLSATKYREEASSIVAV